MRPVVTDGVALSVGWSVTLVSPAKMTELMEMLFGLRTQMGPKNNVLDGYLDLPWEWAVLREREGRPIVKYREALSWAVQKWLNRWRCCFGLGLAGAQVNVLGGDAHWRHLLNTIKASMCCGDAALLLWPLVMAALRSRCGHYILVLFLSSFFPSRNLSRRRLDVYHTYTHGVALECRPEMCCTQLAGNAGPKKSPKIRHLGTIAKLCRAISLQLRHVSTIEKKFVKQQYLPRMSSQYGEQGPLTAEIRSGIWGTPANFNGFRVLAALLHSTLVVSVSQTLRRWTEGATYIRQGGHHVGHWPTFLLLMFLFGAAVDSCLRRWTLTSII